MSHSQLGLISDKISMHSGSSKRSRTRSEKSKFRFKQFTSLKAVYKHFYDHGNLLSADKEESE